MQDKILEISHFSKSYSAAKRAVDDLSLDVYAGDIYGFIGQNGAGKTTTLRAVTGVMDFSEGDIFICGKSVRRDRSPANRSRRTYPTIPICTNF